ncbi:sulfate transporter CysZ [Marinomonas balearica]|uniref:Sulfate transporter CysZ n=1 Tax=Marinomonas balearica TaxID=491947 RepID=A0A4R6M843_9GAMM|nr:sulfate transporter CysZ [Marinomonas balearica]TDO97504.1 CysZ protein [Marinomonas balearica]
MIIQPFQVVGAFFKSLPIILSPGMRLFILAPLVANIALMALLYMVALSYFGSAVDFLMGFLPDWMSFLNWLFLLVFGGIVAVLFFYSFSVGVNIIAAPFMAFLAEKVEEKETGHQFESTLSLSEVVKIAGRSIQRELQKLFYFLPRLIVLLLLSFVPVINLVSPILLLLFSAWMLAIQYMDYSFDNHKLSFREMREALRSKPLLCWTFGFIVMVGLTVPFLNLFVMPIAVVAATLLWIDQFSDRFELASTQNAFSND